MFMPRYVLPRGQKRQFIKKSLKSFTQKIGIIAAIGNLYESIHIKHSPVFVVLAILQ